MRWLLKVSLKNKNTRTTRHWSYRGRKIKTILTPWPGGWGELLDMAVGIAMEDLGTLTTRSSWPGLLLCDFSVAMRVTSWSLSSLFFIPISTRSFSHKLTKRCSSTYSHTFSNRINHMRDIALPLLPGIWWSNDPWMLVQVWISSLQSKSELFCPLGLHL